MVYAIQRVVAKGKEYYYLYHKFKRHGRIRRRYLRRATPQEIQEYLKSLENKKMTIRVPCSNPKCKNKIALTESQRQKFFTTYPQKYRKLILPYCSHACREAHRQEAFHKL